MLTPIKIRPMTDLAKNTKDIDELCVKQNLPVFITKNGANHLVIMSQDYYENLMFETDKLKDQITLCEKLIAAAGESRRGEGRDFDEVMDEIDAELMEMDDDGTKIPSYNHAHGD